jgi:hypothetical protein
MLDANPTTPDGAMIRCSGTLHKTRFNLQQIETALQENTERWFQ